MTNMRLWILSLLLFLISCRPEPIPIDIAQPPPKLVVASQIIPSQVMLVAVTRTFSALSGADKQDTIASDFLNGVLVKDALVTVSYMGRTDTLFMLVPGIYASIHTLQYDYGVYSLYVHDPVSGLEATALSTLLPQVKFDTIVPRISRTATDTTVYADYTFRDLPGVDNWYMVGYYRKMRSGDTTSIDINTFFSRGSNQLADFELISDRTFADNTYSASRELAGMTASDTIAVTISNISEGYFQFLSAYQRAGNLFNQLTGEPINYPSNVINGYGFFNTHYPDVHFFELVNY